MDKKDTQILEILSKNCRIPANTIAKALNVSKDTVKYRIANLEKNFISQYILFIDARKLGLTRYHILIRLNATSSEREKIITQIAKEPYIMWINSFIGTYDFQVIVDATTPFHFNELKNKIISYCKDKMNNYIILTHISDHIFSMSNPHITTNTKIDRRDDTAFSATSYTNNFPVNEQFEEIATDKTDLHLLQELSINPKAKLVELEKKLDINRQTIKKHITKLLQEKVILNFGTVMNTQELGYITYYMLVRLEQDTPKQKIQDAFATITNNLFYSGQMIGDYDMIIYLYAKTPEELNNAIEQFRSAIEQHILHYDLLVQNKVHYWKQFTDGIFQTLKKRILN